MYTRFDFGKQLAEQVNRGYNVPYLSYWAREKYLNYANRLDDETHSAMMAVIAMSEKDEYVLSKEELLKLAHDLQKEI